MGFKYSSLLLLTILLCAPNIGRACIGPPAHKQTFLSQLPNEADEKPVVAKIKILTKTQTKRSHEYGVEVITGLKGLKKGQKITVSVIAHSCQNSDSGKIGDIYYIAGKMTNVLTKKFEGEWQSVDIQQEARPRGSYNRSDCGINESTGNW